MRATSISEIVEYAEKFERDLVEFYQGISDHTKHEGVRMVADYIARHTRHINEMLNDLTEEERHRICSIPLSYKPPVPGKQCFELIELPADAKADDVLETAIKFDECLLDMYRSVARQDSERDVKEFFEELVQTLERDQVGLKMIKAENYF
jgi:rubrerythrin